MEILMNGLNKITEKIINEANDRARVITEEARKRCIEISNEYAKRADERRLAVREAAEKEAEEIISRSKSSAASDKKSSLLKIKSELVDEAFRLAREEIDSLSPEKRGELTVSLATAAVFEIISTQKQNLELYGEQPDCLQYELILGKRDLDAFGEAAVLRLRERVAEKYGEEYAAGVVLSAKPAAIDGGAIIRCGDIESNASLARLFASLHESLEREVEAYLFADEGKRS